MAFINAAKLQFGIPCGRIIGHVVSKDGIVVDPDKIVAIIAYEIPIHITGVKGFWEQQATIDVLSIYMQK